MVNNDIVFVPGAWTKGQDYGPWPTMDIWLKKTDLKLIKPPKIIVGYSLGASWALSHINFDNQTKFILVNPLLDRKSLSKLFFNWLKFLKQEGITESILVSPNNWLYSLFLAVKLSQIDLMSYLLKIPKENLTIIKGEQDKYFCDSLSLNKAYKYNLPVKLVAAGHNWNDNIAKTVKEFL